MSVELYLDKRLLQERADAAGLGLALIALRGRGDAELELSGAKESLCLDKRGGLLHAALLDDRDGSTNILDVGWDRAVEAAAEFLAGLPGRPGGLLAELREPWEPDDDCPLCQAMKNGLL